MALEQAVVTTLFNQKDEIADEVLHHTVLTNVLKEEGRIKKFSGGYEIRKPVMYNDTQVGGFYAGYQSFSLNAIDDLTAFQFAIRQLYEPVAISGREKRANRDREQLLDLADAKMEGAIARIKNAFSTSIKGDGTTALGFDGIQKVVAASPTAGTYGGITRSGNSFTQNNTVSVSGGITVGNVQDSITEGIQEVVRGDEYPDLGLCSAAAWRALHGSLTAIQRITKSERKAVAGFRALNYDGVDFVYDGGFQGTGSASLTGSTIRLINTKYLTFDMVRDADFAPLTPKMDRPTDMDAFFTVIIVEGNLCCSAPAFNNYIA